MQGFCAHIIGSVFVTRSIDPLQTFGNKNAMFLQRGLASGEAFAPVVEADGTPARVLPHVVQAFIVQTCNRKKNDWIKENF